MKLLFLDCDTLRADHLSCYGYRRPTSPHVDRLAAAGTAFENHFSPSIPTQPAHTTMFTGQFGVTHGVMAHASTITQLAPEAPWLPAILRRAGVLTVAIDNLFDTKPWFGRGWSEYVNPRALGQLLTADDVNAVLIPWLQRHARDDWFLFVHYWDAHTPYLPPEPFASMHYATDHDPVPLDAWRRQPAFPFFERWHLSRYGEVNDLDRVRALYDGEISYLDDRLGEVFAVLDELGIADETLVVLTSDHGEVMYDHPGFFDHAGLYDDNLHVPLIVRGPGVKAGARVSAMRQHADLAPTVLDLFGLETPTEMDGRSLAPALRGEALAGHDALYLSEATWEIKWGLRTPEWKLIKVIDPGVHGVTGDELYDLRADPCEQRNLFQTRSDVADALELRLRRWWEAHLGNRPDPLREQARVGVPARTWVERVRKEQGLTAEEWVRRGWYV